MKKIAILIDYTDGSKVTLSQAILLAHKTHARLYAINIATSNDKFAQAESDLKTFIKENTDSWESIQTEIGVGNLFDAVPAILKKIDPDLVVLCTHGVKGMFQHLFGAHILKLVQVIPFPSIVLQENNKKDLSSIDNILFPLGPHPEFETKIKQTTKIADELAANIVLYEIDRPGLETENQLNKNLQNSKDYFSEHHINFSRVLDDLKVISAGYSRQTLDYAMENNISLISIMSTVSKNDVLFGVSDKENFLINTMGIPVLCCNQ